MQDHFMEEVVTKHRDGINRILYMISWIVIVLSGFTAVFMFSFVSRGLATGAFDWISLIMMLLSGGICAYTYFFHDRLMTEYEYTFTNGALECAERGVLRKGRFRRFQPVCKYAGHQTDELVPEPGG